MMMRTIYLDHNATTPVHPEVLEAMEPYFTERFGNASSIHAVGRQAKAGLEEARAVVADVLGCKTSEIYFTSGGTESDNFAIKGRAFASRNKGRHVITSSVEHHAVMRSCRFLQREGFEVTFLPVSSEGFVDPDALRKAIRPDTVLVSVMHANNETGVVQDIEALASVSREAGVCFHTDAVQSTGKIPFKISEVGCDLLSISAHKIYGPKGVGAIYIRSGTEIQPWNEGGGHERGRRAGTENVAGAVGLAKALQIAQRDMKEESQKMLAMTNRFFRLVRERIPDAYLNGSFENRVPNTLNISFRGVEGESVILSLDLKGISVSSGSACTSGATEPSHVLTAMGIPPELAQASVRFSFGRGNTESDVDQVADVLAGEIERLRKISPLYARPGG